MPTNRMLEGSLILKQDVSDACFDNAPNFIRKLLEVFGISFPVPENENFVIYSFETPTEDQKTKLWVKTDRAGHFVGYFLFVGGKWQRIFDHSIYDVVWKSGMLSTDLEDGFQLIDGTVASIPVATQQHIMTFYRIDPVATVNPLFPVYDYFATIYLGI